MSNSLDPDQDRRSVGPDLGPNCLQRLSAQMANVAANKERCYLASLMTYSVIGDTFSGAIISISD